MIDSKGNCNYKKEFVDFLIDSEALLFGDFTTKSGRLSPYFINTGKFRSGEQIKALGRFYAQTIMEQIERGNIDRNINFLFGPAYKGIPLVITTSIALSEYGMDINYCFNRKEAKDHGEGGGIVGYEPRPGDKALIIEDVITAGTAVREVIPVLRKLGVDINGLIVSVDRMEKADGDVTAIQSLSQDEGIQTYPVINIKDILHELENYSLQRKNSITGLNSGTYEKISAYMREYCI